MKGDTPPLRAQKKIDSDPDMPRACYATLSAEAVSTHAPLALIVRQSVYAWIEQGKLLAWETIKRGRHIRHEQILGEGEVVAGIKDVLDIIPDPKTAWRFLTEESPFFDTPQRPIDVLKSSDVAAVCAAARSIGETFS